MHAVWSGQRESRFRTLERLHFCWFDDTVDVLPLTPGRIRAVSALLKHRSYSSGVACVSVIRCLPRELGLPVDPVTNFESERAEGSTLRGIGPSTRQSLPLPLDELASLPQADQPLALNGPVEPENPSKSGAVCTKAAMAATTEASALRLQSPTVGPLGNRLFGGLSWLNLCGPRSTRHILPDLSVEAAQIVPDDALHRVEVANMGADLATEALNLPIAIRRAESADDPALPVNDATWTELPLRSHARRADLWHWCTCDHLAYKVRLEILVGAVLHLACSETKCLDVF